ncbi:hypothetical protein AVEN_252491-1 [Araneus ventricosus]|uniref:Uncharacterized protein n=1 Tax=Araneus ventricosus TaxID=182803 RepID=A0A4Y2AST7_ARAVE|nr:hypothetical protein AVEN_252491-1 [Araneus ventricosus]
MVCLASPGGLQRNPPGGWRALASRGQSPLVIYILLECSRSVSHPIEKRDSLIENPELSTSKQSTKKESEGRECLEQQISPVSTKETGAIPKIKVAAANPKLERDPKEETGATPKLKLPRSLACILNSNPDEKEYVHPYFMKGRPDLLNEVVRKPLMPFVESNVRVKKEVLSDEDSVTQESMECASQNQESSRNKSNNISVSEDL